MTRRTPAIWLVWLAALLPAGAAAQTIQFADLPGHVKVGDSASVIDGNGTRFDGSVTELTPSSMTLLIYGQYPRTFQDTSVRRVLVGDSLWNGTAIGLAVGALSGAFIGAAYGVLSVAICSDDNKPGKSCSFPTSDFASAVGWSTAIGGAVGAGIDAARFKRLSIADGRRSRVLISPSLGEGRQAVVVSVRF